MCQLINRRAAMLVGLLIAAGPAPAHGAPADQEKASAKSDISTALDGMWSTLSSLHTGAGAAECSSSFGSAQREEAVYSFIFDFDTGHSRVDRRFVASNRVVTRVDSPEETIFHLVGSHIVERERPVAGARIEGENPFDIRILSLISFGELLVSNDDMTCRTWERFRAHLDEFPPPSVSEADDGLLAIKWEMVAPFEHPARPNYKHSLYRRVTFVDPRRRFVPMRTEVWDGFGPTTEIAGKLYSVTETKWETKEDVPVPIECIYDIVGAPKHAELRFDWKSIGGEIDPRAFTVAGLELPIDTLVIDDRLGTSIIESVIGRPSETATLPIGRQGRWRWLLTGVSVAVLIITVLAIWGRKSVRARGN